MTNIYLYTLIIVTICFGWNAWANSRNAIVGGFVGGVLFFIALAFVRVFVSPFFGRAFDWSDFISQVAVTIGLSLIPSCLVYYLIFSQIDRINSLRSIKRIQTE